MKLITKKALIFALVAIAALLAGCSTQADRVSHNISKEADNFNVIRRIAVINARTGKPLFELIGAFSLGNNGSNELTVTCHTGPNEYKKHFIYLNEYTMYVVEDISGAEVSPYKYEINYLPEMIVPLSMLEFTRED